MLNLRILKRMLGERLGFKAENIYALQNPDKIIGTVKEYNPAAVISDNNYEGVWGRVGIAKLVDVERLGEAEPKYAYIRRILHSGDNRDLLMRGAEMAGLKNYILLLKPIDLSELEKALEGIE